MQTQIDKRRRRQGPGASPVAFGASPGYRFVIRAVQVLFEFDRLQIAALGGVPFGTVSRILATLENEGYIVRTGTAVQYDVAALTVNPDLAVARFNYSAAEHPTSIQYRKTERWPQLMAEWRAYLLARGEEPCE